MSILSGQSIQRRSIITPCLPRTTEHGLTYGLGPAGYDLRLDLGKGETFAVRRGGYRHGDVKDLVQGKYVHPGEFLLAATVEQFVMPYDVVGVVHDKSTLARQGLTVQNTIIEPGWRGYLTLELVNHSKEVLTLIQGQAIAQVVFHLTDEPVNNPYFGKYQDQAAGPQGPRS